MKRVVLFAAVLILTAGLASAEAPAATTEAAPQNDQPLFAAEEGGGCVMPDTTGLSEEASLDALLESGFEVTPTQQQVPMCPTTFQCNSIFNCGKSTQCAVTNIGQCCQTTAGPVLCCINGPILVERCRCRCTGNPCSIQCPNNTNVKMIC